MVWGENMVRTDAHRGSCSPWRLESTRLMRLKSGQVLLPYLVLGHGHSGICGWSEFSRSLASKVLTELIAPSLARIRRLAFGMSKDA